MAASRVSVPSRGIRVINDLVAQAGGYKLRDVSVPSRGIRVINRFTEHDQLCGWEGVSVPSRGIRVINREAFPTNFTGLYGFRPLAGNKGNQSWTSGGTTDIT